MKKDGKYRYSLQFGDDTDEQTRVGEFLEKLGNKKSSFIVKVLNEYLSAHPEMIERNAKIEVTINPLYNRKRIERMIQDIIERKLADFSAKLTQEEQEVELSDTLEEDLTQMLNNLELFQ